MAGEILMAGEFRDLQTHRKSSKYPICDRGRKTGRWKETIRETHSHISRSIKKNKKMEDDEDATATEEEETRIFVGGIGENVKEEEIVEQIFRASLGKVKGIHFVRTKGRSLAYLDFLPSSPKSLPKLFSTYNGCVWKGGRLKLEKAKEHYLVRLKREWEDEAELSRCAPNSDIIDAAHNVIASSSHSSNNKLLKSDKTQLQIFFPKLQKVKSLPFSGTGKHKYSFQRVEVPPLPIHFCDCEEHYVPSHMAKENRLRDLDAQSGGINEEELNMMQSVMNKFLQREKSSKSASNRAELGKEGDGSIKSINDPLSDDNEVTDEEDEDNLIINMVTGRDKRMTLSGTSEKGSKFKHSNILKVQEREIEESNKKRKSLINEESNINESVSRLPKRFGNLKTHACDADILLEPPGSHQSITNLSWSQKSSWKALVGDKGNNVFSISHVLPGSESRKEEQHRSSCLNTPDSGDSQNPDLSKHGNFRGQSGQSKELEELAEAQPSNDNNKSGRGASWLHKLSWTQLVNETNNSFSISQILPGNAFEKMEQPTSNRVDVASFTDSKHCDLVKHDKYDSMGDGIGSVGPGDGLVTASRSSTIVASPKDQKPNALNVEQGTVEKTMEAVSNEVSAPAPVKNGHPAPKQTSIVDMGIPVTCSFMRSATSRKEWANTKAVLSGSAKRKYNDK